MLEKELKSAGGYNAPDVEVFNVELGRNVLQGSDPTGGMGLPDVGEGGSAFD
jgi:hypothetical protein